MIIIIIGKRLSFVARKRATRKTRRPPFPRQMPFAPGDDACPRSLALIHVAFLLARLPPTRRADFHYRGIIGAVHPIRLEQRRIDRLLRRNLTPEVCLDVIGGGL
jgi:hypothetical protein